MILLQTQAEDGLDLDVTNLWKGETIYVSVSLISFLPN